MPNDSTAKRPATGAALFKPDVTDAITAAAFEELADKGYTGMSMDSVARAAGVGKSAIYRRWVSKEEMTVEVMSRRIVVTEGEFPDSGSFRGDIRMALEEMLTWLSDPKIGRIYVDMLANGVRNPVLANALTEHIGSPRRARGMSLLDRARARGELSDSISSDLLLDLIGSIVFWRLIARRETVSSSYLDEVAELIAAGVASMSQIQEKEI